jgi:hypothetical protein
MPSAVLSAAGGFTKFVHYLKASRGRFCRR